LDHFPQVGVNKKMIETTTKIHKVNSNNDKSEWHNRFWNQHFIFTDVEKRSEGAPPAIAMKFKNPLSLQQQAMTIKL